VDESCLESLLDNVLGVFQTPCVAEREPKNPLSVAFDDGFKRQVISTFGGSDQLVVPG
jgi:hypothetical protein